MQQKDALELKEQWGDKLCEHPDLEREYELGSATDDYVCTTCGETKHGNTWNIGQKEMGVVQP